MMVLRSALLEREGFDHGFGTRRSAPHDFPAAVHILLQVHGEKIVVLTEHTARGTQHAGEESKGPGISGESGIWNMESGIAGSNADIKFSELPVSPFQFDEGDAMASDIPGVSMGIRTADCLPLLIADRVKGTAAAVHCGWRSLATGLAGKVVKALAGAFGSDPGQLLAALGPSIGPCCYEVGEEVRETFPTGLVEEGLFERRGRRLYLDLAAGVKTQLILEGLAPETVDEIVGCTSCNPDLFWSWRARKEEERMISYITAREPH
ncbi:MAG: polyphenol oxidase family protein [bacterium]|nr:MAG: polyphenol oxidase family protein [bacterium]